MVFVRLVLITLVLGALISGVRLRTPEDGDAPATEVSEARAREHLRVVAKERHASGTPEAKRVREYIRDTLKSMDVDVEFDASNDHGRELVNVLARLPGREGGGVVLLACHYDSVHRSETSQGPGAGDDGAAVASFIEVARALKAGKPLANEIWLLFTDGEELGLLGADRFCSDEERLAQVDVVFNFEGIGNRGPSVMFQSSAGNSQLISEFAKLDILRVAPSFAPAIYEKLPNDTDFTVFSENGLPGLNFAIVGGRSAYHRPWDTPANLTPKTLQYQVDTAFALAQHFGDVDLDSLESESDHVYFDLVGRAFVHYSHWWNWLLLALGLTGFVLQARRAHAHLISFWLAPFSAIFLALGVGLVTYALTRWLPPLAEYACRLIEATNRPRGDALSAGCLTWGSVSVGFAAACTWLRLAGGDPVRVGSVALGASFMWLLLSIAACIWLPLGGYFALLPLCLAVLAAPSFTSRVDLGETSHLAALAALAILILSLPSLGLIVRLLSPATDLTALLCALAVALAVPLMLPLLHWTRATTRAPLISSWLIALVLLIGAGVLRAAGL